LSRLSSLTPIGRAGRYEVLGRLAEGGMAKIFLARARGAAGVERMVVLKHLLPETQKNEAALGTLLQEARLLSRLSHPNVVSIEEFGEQSGTHYLAMEWVRGVSLRSLFDAAKERGGLPWPLVARLFSNLAAGLHYVHVAKDERGRDLHIVHRDVTPENVIVSWSGSPKLLDFGIAKSSIDPQKTQAGQLKGKFQYIPPEQYEGKAADARSDVFALSVTLYEALTGESLYARANEYETVAAIVLDPAIPSVRAIRPELPEALEQIVQGGLKKDREQRTASADAIAVALETLLADQGQRVRDTDVAAYLAELFPGQAQKDPVLDRSMRFDTSPREATAAHEQVSHDRLEAVLRGAEADIDADEFVLSARRKQRTMLLGLLFLVLIAGSFLAWAVVRATDSSALSAPEGPPT
jgi:serine/threonine protein kinase